MIRNPQAVADKHRLFSQTRSTRRERGAVFVEFVMVAPVMLLIAGSALRFYQELQAQEIGITFAREIATLAYNRCIDRTITKVVQIGATQQDTLSGDEQPTLDLLQQCLQSEIIPQFMASWPSAMPIAATSTLTITVDGYRCDITSIGSTGCAKIGRASCSCSATTCTASTTPCFTATDAPDPGGLSGSARNRLVTAKIEFVMAPLATFIPALGSRTVSYAATV